MPISISNLYKGGDARDAAIFEPLEGVKGVQFFTPDQFQHMEWALVAELPRNVDSDGYAVRIYESRAPARFFKVEALPHSDLMGYKPGFTLSTGSGDEAGSLVVAIAIAANDGMLGAER